MQAESGYGVVEPVRGKGQPASGLRRDPHRALVLELDPHETFHGMSIDLVERLGAAQVGQDPKGLTTEVPGALASDFTKARQRLVSQTFEDRLDVESQIRWFPVVCVGQEPVYTLCTERDQAVLRGFPDSVVPGRQIS